ncbi:MAG: hypothetical protein IKI49_04975 [Oscillospiraceae bacterium]|nr:hypothetical protein [Oscillospiraceae bacterium]
MTCFFIGHRNAPQELTPKLSEAVERHITEYGVTDFVVGHYGRFDAMAAGAVRDAKKRHRSVTLTLLLPYYPFGGNFETPEFDGTLYPAGLESVPRAAAIVRANRYMIEESDFLICYDREIAGGTRDIVKFARRREKNGLIRVTNLAE